MTSDNAKIAMIEKVHIKRYHYFRAYMYDGILQEGKFGFPVIKRCKLIPYNPISFVESRTKRRTDNRWLHFYAEDFNFECVWSNPLAYVKLLKSFAGVIAPDFSMYGDLPKCYQIWNCFRNRSLAAWWQRLGINVVPSVSWSDSSSFEWCFEGLPNGGTVSVSGNGCCFNPYSRKRFIDGFNEMKSRLHPDTIIAVGYVPRELHKTSELIILPGYTQQRAVRNG